MATTVYTCTEGDTLATVAFKAYGSVERIYDIVKANKGLSVTAYLPAGLEINIPLEPSTAGTVSASLLPPWKR